MKDTAQSELGNLKADLVRIQREIEAIDNGLDDRPVPSLTRIREGLERDYARTFEQAGIKKATVAYCEVRIADIESYRARNPEVPRDAGSEHSDLRA